MSERSLLHCKSAGAVGAAEGGLEELEACIGTHLGPQVPRFIHCTLHALSPMDLCPWRSQLPTNVPCWRPRWHC